MNGAVVVIINDNLSLHDNIVIYSDILMVVVGVFHGLCLCYAGVLCRLRLAVTDTWSTDCTDVLS